MIRITSKQDGFRRAGLAHPARPVDHPDKAFTKEQLAALEAEPMLTVEKIDEKKTGGKGAGSKSAASASSGQAE